MKALKEKVKPKSCKQELIMEAANRAMYEAQIKLKRRRISMPNSLIEQENRLKPTSGGGN
jgi:hypothetical protein